MDSLDTKVGVFTKFVSFLPSSIKIPLYRLLGAQIGRHVNLAIGSVIVARSFRKVRIGDYSSIDSFSIIICDEIELGEGCHIGPFVWVYGGSLLWMIPRECKFSMGNITYIGARSVINATEDVSIGDYTGIGAGTTIYTHGFQSSYIDGEPHKEAPVNIGRNVWVQPKTLILPGVSIGDNSIIAAGSVVTKDIPPNVFAIGCPCQPKSDVAVLKKSNSIEDRENRALKVIGDYFNSLKFIKKENVKVDEIERNEWLLTVKKFFGLVKENYRIFYVQTVNENVIMKVCKIRGYKLLISLLGIDSDYEKKLTRNNILWIDISGKKTNNRDKLPPLFYGFLRDYYGVGLISSSANKPIKI